MAPSMFGRELGAGQEVHAIPQYALKQYACLRRQTKKRALLMGAGRVCLERFLAQIIALFS